MNTNPQINASEVVMTAIRAQGPGGQNVNKVSNAVCLRFDIEASSLPFDVKQRLQNMRDHHISRDGFVTIKAQKFRSLPKNQEEALRRLNALVAKAYHVPRERKPTKPSKASIERRLQQKSERGHIKSSRSKGSGVYFE
ncbi:MAG: aminoacyl-tRNA hydrolase [Burkholderiaceae bacterium]|nr:aminoacyl-tRNA hydrolase [Burkholderiaceae bacterium]